MHAVLNAALPIFARIFTGFLCGRLGVFSTAATDSLNRFANYLALPALMFLAMARLTPEQASQIGFGLSRLRGRRAASASIEGLDAGYSNVGFMGIPLCLLVFGPGSLPAAVIATLFTACVLFLIAVVIIETDLIAARVPGSPRAKCSLHLSGIHYCWVPSPDSRSACPASGCPIQSNIFQVCWAARLRRAHWSASACSWPRRAPLAATSRRAADWIGPFTIAKL
jgi:hypothetical protein